jgi:hypothetical protein
MTITEDPDTFLTDFGVAVTGTVSGTAVLDMPDQILAGGLAISTEYSIIGRYSVFGGLKYADTLTVDSVNYTVREVTKIDDGVFCRVALIKV